MNKTIKISIVSPVYRAEKMVHMLVERIGKSVTTITDNYEIILVNDASPDASWQMIERECAQNKSVKGINLSRNFGFTMSAFSFLLALYNVVARLVGFISFPGYTTTVFSIWFVGGLMLFVMGILGLYIGKIFDQVKGRQLFVVKDKVNIE